MKPIDEMLRHLARPDVVEFGLVSGRLPCVKVGEQFQPVDDTAPGVDDTLQMLVTMGGSRYVESLSAKPTSWTSRLEGVGTISITAVMRDNVVQARFKVTKRDPNAKPPAHDARKLAAAAPALAAGEGAQPARRKVASLDDPDSEEPTLETRSAVAAPAPPRATLEDEPRPKPRRAPKPDAREDTGVGERTLGERTLESRSDDRIVDRRSPIEIEEPPAVPPPPSMGSLEQTPGFPIVPPPPLDEGDLVSHPSLVAPLSEPLAQVPLPPPATPPPPAQAPQRISRIPYQGSRPPPGPEAARSRGANLAGLDPLLALARREDASDLHVVAGRPPLLRRLGELRPRGDSPIASKDVDAMIGACVPASYRDSLSRHGSCDFALDHPELGRFRVNASRQRTGYKLCFRLIPREVPTLADLGLPPALADATQHHQGLIIVSGPTGHGKTTTLAALVDVINQATTHHVITIEDPIEHVHFRRRALMSQREVRTHTQSFDSALKAALREDPDVIVIGELRDLETVRLAVSASDTGHLVLGTMNTPNAAKTIDRLIDMFPASDQQQIRMTLAGGLRLVVSQRLVPTADAAGRVAAVEVLPGSIPLWSLIRDSKTFQIPSLQQRGKALGIVRMEDSLNDLARAGTITSEIAQRVLAEQNETLGRRP